MERSLDMATIEKIRNDIAKTKDKIAELQKKQRALEAQLAEEENQIGRASCRERV